MDKTPSDHSSSNELRSKVLSEVIATALIALPLKLLISDFWGALHSIAGSISDNKIQIYIIILLTISIPIIKMVPDKKNRPHHDFIKDLFGKIASKSANTFLLCSFIFFAIFWDSLVKQKLILSCIFLGISAAFASIFIIITKICLNK